MIIKVAFYRRKFRKIRKERLRIRFLRGGSNDLRRVWSNVVPVCKAIFKLSPHLLDVTDPYRDPYCPS